MSRMDQRLPARAGRGGEAVAGRAWGNSAFNPVHFVDFHFAYPSLPSSYQNWLSHRVQRRARIIVHEQRITYRLSALGHTLMHRKPTWPYMVTA